MFPPWFVRYHIPLAALGCMGCICQWDPTTCQRRIRRMAPLALLRFLRSKRIFQTSHPGWVHAKRSCLTTCGSLWYPEPALWIECTVHFFRHGFAASIFTRASSALSDSALGSDLPALWTRTPWCNDNGTSSDLALVSSLCVRL